MSPSTESPSLAEMHPVSALPPRGALKPPPEDAKTDLDVIIASLEGGVLTRFYVGVHPGVQTVTGFHIWCRVTQRWFVTEEQPPIGFQVVPDWEPNAWRQWHNCLPKIPASLPH